MDTSIVNDTVKCIFGEHILPEDMGSNTGKGILDFSCLGGLETRPFIEFVEREYRDNPFVFEAKASRLIKSWGGSFAVNTPVYVVVCLEEETGEKRVLFIQRYGDGKMTLAQVPEHQCRTYVAIYESGNARGTFCPRVFIFDLMYKIVSPHVGERELSVLSPTIRQLNRLITPKALKCIDDAIEERYRERAKTLTDELKMLTERWSRYSRRVGTITTTLTHAHE